MALLRPDPTFYPSPRLARSMHGCGSSLQCIVYEKLGVRILQRAWFNFDLAWSVALIVSGFVTALV